MGFEKRNTAVDSAVPDDATEVLPARRYLQAAQQEDPDATVVLPAAHRGASLGSTADDATAVLPAHSAPQSAADRHETVAAGGTGETTRLMPAPRAGVAGDSAAKNSTAGQLKATLGSKAATGSQVARTTFSAFSARAKETADRVKKERAARKAEKSQASTPTVQQPAVQPPAASPAGADAYQQTVPLMFGGRMSNQQAAASQAGGYPLATSAETSPSGRLQMLTPSHIRQTRPSLWTLIQHFFAGGTMFVLLLGSVLFFIMSAMGQQLDETAFQEFSYQFVLYTRQTSSLLDLIPATAGVLAAIGIVFVLLWKHRFVPALVGLGMAVGANVTTQLLKNYLIVKPNLGIQEAILNSAPSGHTTFAAAAGLALFLASPKRFRPAVAFFSMLFTVAAGYSTVVNGWHRPSDVVTAILVTGLWAVLGLVILRFMRSEELDMSDTQRSGLILVPLLTITGFFVGFCALALYAVTWVNPIPGSAFVAAACLIAAVATLTTSIQIALLRPQNKQRSAYRRVWGY